MHESVKNSSTWRQCGGEELTALGAKEAEAVGRNSLQRRTELSASGDYGKKSEVEHKLMIVALAL